MSDTDTKIDKKYVGPTTPLKKPSSGQDSYGGSAPKLPTIKKVLKPKKDPYENVEEASDSSPAGLEAKKLGLHHVGGGSYANSRGLVTHKSVKGKLTPVKKPRQATTASTSKLSPDIKRDKVWAKNPDTKGLAAKNKNTKRDQDSADFTVQQGLKNKDAAASKLPSWEPKPSDVDAVTHSRDRSMSNPGSKEKALAAFKRYKKAKADGNEKEAARYRDLAIGLARQGKRVGPYKSKDAYKAGKDAFDKTIGSNPDYSKKTTADKAFSSAMVKYTDKFIDKASKKTGGIEKLKSLVDKKISTIEQSPEYKKYWSLGFAAGNPENAPSQKAFDNWVKWGSIQNRINQRMKK
jgi:hypothetical protein